MAQNRSKSISFGFHFPGCGFRGKSNSPSLTPSSLPKPEKVKVKGKSLSRVRLFATPWTPTMLLHPWDFPSKNTGVGCHCLLQRIFLTQGSNPGLLHCRQTLYCLSYQGRHQFAVSGDLTHTHTHIWQNRDLANGILAHWYTASSISAPSLQPRKLSWESDQETGVLTCSSTVMGALGTKCFRENQKCFQVNLSEAQAHGSGNEHRDPHPLCLLYMQSLPVF